MRKRLLILTLAGLAATASVAGAQVLNDNHDGGGPVAGVLKTTNCGQLQESIVNTANAVAAINSVPWVNLPAAQTPIFIPGGQSRCIKVVFTAETSCTGNNGPDYCYVQALIDGAPMDPDGADFQAIDSEDATGDGHAYEWVKRVGPGNHLVEIEQRVGNAATTFTHDEITFDVQIHG